MRQPNLGHAFDLLTSHIMGSVIEIATPPLDGFNTGFLMCDVPMLVGGTIAMAIEAVAKTDSEGNTYIGRKALRDAVFATKFEGVSGPIACDQYGECAQFKPAVFEFTDADPKTFKIGVNPKKIWP
ncbi:MAG TPA: hypothetical protein VEJ16_15940 [Alphaproteobacteria bacterium]|nr:hypothetical protein [Alphaproteobacteria bacterium]